MVTWYRKEMPADYELFLFTLNEAFSDNVFSPITASGETLSPSATHSLI